MLIKKFAPSLLALILLISVIAVTEGTPKTNKTPQTKTEKVQEVKELRAIWVTYMDLDMRDSDLSYKTFQNKFRHIADTSKKNGFNTLIVQVRPFCDALYDSQYFPYSHILTGKQGKNPGYDPLKYMCEYTHKINLTIHAWINPYRIRFNDSPEELCENHPYKNNRNIGVNYKGDIYINPASSDGRELIKCGIKEIIKNYDVDGIQFDDYFYPTTDKNFDNNEYNQYVKTVGENNAISLDEWRNTNVNILIAEIYSVIKKMDKNITFGISPQGNIENNKDLYADIKSWCSQYGYIDYICPQLYFSPDNPALTFKDALNQWLKIDFHENVQLYIGIAGYKIGTDADENTWKNADNILSRELKMIRKNNIKGFIFFSFADLERQDAKTELKNLHKLLN